MVVKEVSCGRIADMSWLLWAVERDMLVVAEEKELAITSLLHL